jgi:acetyl-CoA synthetase
VQHRDDFDGAVAAFRWPAVGERLNSALNWFAAIAVGNPRTALRIIGEDGTHRSYSFAEMAARSDQLATSLAAMKLGAVVMPATTAPGPKDLADRVIRGAVRHGVTATEQVDKFAAILGDFGRIAIGDAPGRWRPHRLVDAAPPPTRSSPTPTEILHPTNASGRMEFMELPKTISGKIRRVDLRALEDARETSGLTQEYRDR